MIRCLECDNLFEPTNGLNTICSDECKLNRKNRMRRKPKIIRNCEWCGKAFQAADRRRKFCSNFCKRKNDTKNRKQLVERRRAERKSYKEFLPDNCEICGFKRALNYCHIHS